MSDQPFHYFVIYSHIHKNKALFGSISISRNQSVEYSEDFDMMKELIEKDCELDQIVILNVIPIIGTNRQKEEETPGDAKILN